MSKRFGGIIGCKDINGFPDDGNIGSTVVVVVVVSHIQRIGCQPEKKLLYTVANPARGLLNREKNKNKKSGSAPPPPPRALLVRRKN